MQRDRQQARGWNQKSVILVLAKLDGFELKLESKTSELLTRIDALARIYDQKRQTLRWTIGALIAGSGATLTILKAFGYL